MNHSIIIHNVTNMDKSYRDMNLWCEKNIKGLHEVWQGVNNEMHVYFSSSKDAAFFALKFM